MKRPRGFDRAPDPDPKPGGEAPEEVVVLPELGDTHPGNEETAETDLTDLVLNGEDTAQSGGAELKRRSLGALTRRRHSASSEADPVKVAKQQVRRARRERRKRERRERRLFSAHARARRRNLLIVLGAITGLAVFVAVGVFTPIMSVRTIEVVGANRVSAEELTRSLLSLEGTPLALVSDVDVHEALREFSLLQQYSVETVPPSTLVVTIQERQPVLAMERGEELMLVDPAGVVVETVEGGERPEGVPMGDGFGSDFTSDRFYTAAHVVQSLPQELRGLVETVKAPTAHSVTFTLSNGVEVLWGDDREATKRAVVLESVIRALEDVDYSYIDVSSADAPVFR